MKNAVISIAIVHIDWIYHANGIIFYFLSLSLSRSLFSVSSPLIEQWHFFVIVVPTFIQLIAKQTIQSKWNEKYLEETEKERRVFGIFLHIPARHTSIPIQKFIYPKTSHRMRACVPLRLWALVCVFVFVLFIAGPEISVQWKYFYEDELDGRMKTYSAVKYSYLESFVRMH